MNRKPKWGSSGGDWSVSAADVLQAVDVAALRRRERLTQKAFAKRYGLAFTTIKDWEQGRRKPDRASRVLLTLIARAPSAVRKALATRGEGEGG